MSDKLMDTEPGGESTQYESIKTVTVPSSKDGGQMGDIETKTATTTQTDADRAERGEKTAENIRYGQKISEEGMGGQTTTSEGNANSGGSFGGAGQDAGEDVGSSAEDRGKEQGYGGDEEMSNEIGG